MNAPKKIDLRLRHKCVRCRNEGRPLKRVWGYPGANAFRYEAQGRIRLMGCVMDASQAPYECRHCGLDWWVKR